ncbi:MAG: non-homologous end-joining DNA ligase [Bacillota bacterium]
MKKINSILSVEELENAKAIKIYDWLAPMLATLTHDYFNDPEWIYERKLDGERCLIYCDKAKNIRLMSRNKKELNDKYYEIADAFSSLKLKNYILDGEIVAFDGNVTDFSKLQERMHLIEDKDIEESKIKVYYYCFDILYYDGYDLRELTLKTRKKVLKTAFRFTSPLFHTKYIKEDGKEYLKKACDKGWEGIIAKDYTSKYYSSRSKKWLKFKCQNRQEFVIVGYTDPEGERIGFGAILIGYYENDSLKYAGKVGTGFTDKMLKELANKFKKIETDKCPLANKEKVKVNNIHWLKPEMVGEVSFTEWTNDNKLRHPSFEGLRTDKDPKDVVNEEKR